MKFFSQILRVTLITLALSIIFIFSVFGFFYSFEVFWVDQATSATVREQFMREPIWYRSCMAGAGGVIGVISSALLLGPIALLYEIRDTMAEVRDRLAVDAGR
jgi:hypothetical protein